MMMGCGRWRWSRESYPRGALRRWVLDLLLLKASAALLLLGLKDVLKKRALQLNIDILPKNGLKKCQFGGREEEESSKRRAPAFGSSWSADSHFWMSWIYPILEAEDFSLPQRTSQAHTLSWPCSWQGKKGICGVWVSSCWVGLRTTVTLHSPWLHWVSEGDFPKRLSSVAEFSLQTLS